MTRSQSTFDENSLIDTNSMKSIMHFLKTRTKQNVGDDGDEEEDFQWKRILQHNVDYNASKGCTLNTIDVIFTNLTVIGKNVSVSVSKNIFDLLFSPFLSVYNRVTHNQHLDFTDLPKMRKIIRNVTGFASPGTMTLVLGSPGSGCSTFLKTLSGDTQTFKNIEGELSFNGINYTHMFKFLIQLLIYNPEADVHFPFLTVEQTLKFAIACRTPEVRIDNVERSQYIEMMKELYEILFGLKNVEKNIVGNEVIRGISGGQRKRVSIVEAMVNNASLFCFDNPTRGLDSSTALEFVQILRTVTDVYQNSTVATLYQASDKIYDLFDYVTVFYMGRQIYFGQIDQAVSYFENLGFIKHARQTKSEFLTAITNPIARKVNQSSINEKQLPQTADDFESIWLNSAEYNHLLKVINVKKSFFQNPEDELMKLKKSQSLVKQKFTFKKSIYTTNYFTQLKACILRNIQSTFNNKTYPITLVISAIIQSLITGSLLYNTPKETYGAFSKGTIIFFACLYFSVMGLAEIPAFFAEKPILDRQRGYTLFHPSAEILAKQLVKLPVRLLSTTCFGIVIYFLTNLKREAGAFFQFYLMINLVVQSIISLILSVCSLMPNAESATGISAVIFMCVLVYSSYMIQRPSMYWWFKWFSYCNPVLYGFEAMITMQFHNLRMPCSSVELIPNGSSYENINSTTNQVCGFVGAAASKILYNGSNDVNGDIYLNLSFGYTFSHAWRNFGLILAFIFGYTIFNCITAEIFNPKLAEAEKLVFIKNAKISKSMFKHLEQVSASDKNILSNETDLEKNYNVENNLVTATSSVDQEIMFNSLGSDSIFTWRDINYEVVYNGKNRKLLESVQGYILPGTLTALMGESGAGKTTLLDVLARRVDVGVITGDMLINGKPLTTSFERRTGYVQQQDLHMAALTVKESLIFSARLRRPNSIPDNEKVEYVDWILKMLHMDDYADAIVGVPGSGLNVEQRKKMSIATELVAKPSLLLFLDEPTSGLDSESSFSIIQVLRELANAGQAILCTIHQPSATLFEKFDKLLLLKNGGQTVYFGDIGHDSQTVINYFEKNGSRKCLETENSAEYILEVIGTGSTASVSQDWFQIWKNSEECKQLSYDIEEFNRKALNFNSDDDIHENLSSKFTTPYMYQLRLVVLRTFHTLSRSLSYLFGKLILSIISGLVVGFSFWNVKHTIVGMQNIMFANLLSFIFSFPLMSQIQGNAIRSREIFEARESKSNIFHWSCLLLAEYINELPYCLISSTIFFVCWYFPIQLNNEPSTAGFWWFTYCFFYQLYYPTFALFVLYCSKDLPTAAILQGLMFSLSSSFCGVFQRPSLMPGFWKFMWRLSPLTYFLGNQMSVLLHNRPVHCGESEFNYLEPPEGLTCGEYLQDYFASNTGYVNNPNETSSCAVCQYSVGDEFLHSIGIHYSDRWRNIGLFCAYIIFNIALMNVLYYLLRVSRVFNFKKPKKLKK